jgi:hypothetical protein
MLVDMGEYLLPIKGDFRGTKGRGIEAAIRAVEAAGTAEWIGLSDRHRVSAVYPQPYGRVFHHLTTSPYVGKVSGRTSHVTNVTSSPSTIAQMQKLADSFEDENFIAELNDAKANYDLRLEFMDRVAANPQV